MYCHQGIQFYFFFSEQDFRVRKRILTLNEAVEYLKELDDEDFSDNSDSDED